MPWVDRITCARVPDRSVLEQFDMIGRRVDMRKLAGVCVLDRTKSAQNQPCLKENLRDAYAYLAEDDDGTNEADNDFVVHPDIVQQYGDRFKDSNVVLRRLLNLVCGAPAQLLHCHVEIVEDVVRGFRKLTNGQQLDGRRGIVVGGVQGSDDMILTVKLDEEDSTIRRRCGFALPPAAGTNVDVKRVNLRVLPDGPAPDHYSLHAYHEKKHNGRLVHKHCAHPDVPMPHCKVKGICKGHFPKLVAVYTHMGPDGFIILMRTCIDIMIVAYNAWATFNYEAHINWEVIANSARATAYIYKIHHYTYKGGDTNRLQARVHHLICLHLCIERRACICA